MPRARWGQGYGILQISEDSRDGGFWSDLVPEGVPRLSKALSLRKNTHLVGVDPGPMDLPRKSLCLGVFVDGGGVEPDLQLITLMGWDASPNPAT